MGIIYLLIFTRGFIRHISNRIFCFGERFRSQLAGQMHSAWEGPPAWDDDLYLSDDDEEVLLHEEGDYTELREEFVTPLPKSSSGPRITATTSSPSKAFTVTTKGVSETDSTLPPLTPGAMKDVTKPSMREGNYDKKMWNIKVLVEDVGSSFFIVISLLCFLCSDP